MIKIRQTVYLKHATDDDLDELYEKYNEVDFMYGDSFVRFYGSPERLQELIRYAEAQGYEPKLSNH